MRVQMVLMVLTAFFISSFYAFSGQELERLDNTMFEETARTGAVFSHDDHNTTAMLDDCTVCHHYYEGKQLIENESSEESLCSECHGLAANQENSIPLQVAYHKQCKNCHFESNIGPVLCGECHIKDRGGA